jgi:hypothetical protein
MAKEVLAGVAGGLVGAGLMKIATPRLESNRELINRRSISPGGSVTLRPSTTYKLAIILIHGDGDPQVEVQVARGPDTYRVWGNEQAIEVVANETVTIAAVNTDTVSSRNSPTIEILSLNW